MVQALDNDDMIVLDLQVICLSPLGGGPDTTAPVFIS